MTFSVVDAAKSVYPWLLVGGALALLGALTAAGGLILIASAGQRDLPW